MKSSVNEAYVYNLHEQNVQHPDSDHESEVFERSLTSTSSLVESESEEGYEDTTATSSIAMKLLLVMP